MSFLKQMRTPTTPGIDKYQTPLLGLSDIYSNLQTQVGILIARLIYQRPFYSSFSNPMKYQHKILLDIIRRNEKTKYGKQHKFNTIKSWADFTKHVPIQDYEALRPYIDQQERTKKPYLTQEQPE